jgi:uncharacterized membrane protein
MTVFRAFTFDGKRSARKALDTIEEKLYTYDWYEEDDVAEISVNSRGSYRVHSTWAQDSDNVPGGIGLGAILGGVIGILFGPGGAIAGAAIGGAYGGLIGASDNIAFEDPELDDFAASLVPDSSALIILGDTETVAAFAAELDDYEVKSFEVELDKESVKALKEEMKELKK